MRKWFRLAIVGVGALILVAIGAVFILARQQAHAMVTNPLEVRAPVDQTPADRGIPYIDIKVVSEGLELVGWYIPSTNGAAVIAQHGFKANRVGMLEEAEILYRHGYGVLVPTVRAHDMSQGELIAFGYHEINDMEVWFDELLQQEGVQQDRIGVLGNSMGGSLVIQLAAQNPGVKAVVAHSPFSSLDDTVSTSVVAFTGLPAFPFAPLMVFWGEQKVGFDSAEIDAKLWIAEISPRPVLILHGGQDTVVSADSGRLLYEAAKEPKELWYEPDVSHAAFDLEVPEAFEARVIAFFDRYLLGE